MEKKTKIIIGGVVLALIAGGGALASQGYKQHKAMKRMFSPQAMMTHMDTNGDLAISRDEVVAGVQKHFATADQNNDGSVTKAELVTTIESMDVPSKMKRRSGKIADRISSHADIDENGKIVASEVENRLMKLHSLADWNDDGVVEITELKRLRPHHRGWRGKRDNNDSKINYDQ